MNPVSSKKTFLIFHDINFIFSFFLLTLIAINTFFSYKFKFVFLFSYICLCTLIFLRVYYYYSKQVENYKLSYTEDLEPLILTFKNYLGKKGTKKSNKKIEFLITRIEKADIHLRNLYKFYIYNYIILISVIYIIFLIFSALSINPFNISSIQTDFMFYILFISLIFNLYLLTIFMIRNYHFKNIDRAKYLFDLIYTSNLNSIFSELEKITFYEKKYEFNEKILELLNEWHKLYYGICPIENSEKEELIYENRQKIMKYKELEKFYNLFHSLRINISNEIISLETEDKTIQKREIMEYLISFLDNYIKLINLNIDARKKEKQKKKDLWNIIRDFFTIIIAIFTIISLVLSIIK